MASRNTRLANFRLSDPNYLAAQNIRDLEATDDPKAGWVGLISKVLRLEKMITFLGNQQGKII